jgi:acyl-CoA thioester hydrolase
MNYRTEIRVRYAETDQMKFAHHSNYIVWFEYARIAMLRHNGFDYAQMEKDGYLLPVLEVGVQYLKPSFFDDLLTIEARVSEVPRASFRIDYKVFNQSKIMICQGFSRHAFMNKENKAIKPPRDFIAAVKEGL